MSARTTRTRLLAATAITFTTLTLAACNSGGGEGVRDEGASAASSATSSPASSTPSPGTSEGTSAGAAGADTEGSASNGSTGGSGSSGSTGSTGSNGSGGTGGTESSTGSKGSDPASLPTRASCSSATTRTTATEVSRPLNHILLTVTNTGSKNCNLTGYPIVRFGEAQSVPPVIEDSKPQAVVTLAPGESGYASVLLSMGDGSGSNGYTAKSLTVSLNKDTEGAARPSLPAKGVYVDDKLSVSYWQSTMADALTW
ncbi:DUF4232 domain-containing protein [Streptomyces sp. NPDC050704]|uniref:DUF4232 domain-containing protein n=1 Tax=Streptomyces sp. NPDC050704 TaxID=3157219 RepID=UPI0034184C7D